MDVVKCYNSQFYQADSDEPETPISVEGFLEYVKMRAIQLGRPISVKYAEGYNVERPIGVDDLTTLI